MLQGPPQLDPTQSSSGETVREVSIGIDLGCINCCIAVYDEGRVEVIPNERGNRKTPSCVTFVDKERICIGESAVEQGYTRRAETTIFGSKYFLGKTTRSDKDVLKDLYCFPFTLREENEDLVFYLEFEDETSHEQKPEEIICLLFKSMKEKAENHLNAKVTKAVVSVPSYFNTIQREKTKEACINAGMDVLEIINDTTAAAIAYTIDNKEIVGHEEDKRTVLVYDQGGNSLSVSLLTVQHGTYKILATTGHDGSGGEQINNRMFRHFVEQFQMENDGADITRDKKAVAKLRKACEEIKVQLSITEEASSRFVHTLCQLRKFQFSMKRDEFNELNEDLFLITTRCVQSVLDIAGLNKENVDVVLLVGGTTCIPKIQEHLGRIFTTEQMKKYYKADEAVACGAAMRAACLTNPSKSINLCLEEITPFEYTLRLDENRAETIFHKYTSIPAKTERLVIGIESRETLTLEIKNDDLTGRPLINVETLKSAGRDGGNYVLKFEVDRCGIFKCSCTHHTSHLTLEMNNQLAIKKAFEEIPAHQDIPADKDSNQGNEKGEGPKGGMQENASGTGQTTNVQNDSSEAGASRDPSGRKLITVYDGRVRRPTSLGTFMPLNVRQFIIFCQDLTDNYKKYYLKSEGHWGYMCLKSCTYEAKQRAVEGEMVTNDHLLREIKFFDECFAKFFPPNHNEIAIYNKKRKMFLDSLLQENFGDPSSSAETARKAKIVIHMKAREALKKVFDTIHTTNVKRRESYGRLVEVQKIRDWLWDNPHEKCSLQELKFTYEQLLEIHRELSSL